MDALDFIKYVLDNNVKLSENVYADEPILRTAAQIKRPEMPKKIREMLALRYSVGAYKWSEARLFYEQAKFMENYEDDFEGEFIDDYKGYYPTYINIPENQLRVYFSWRTKVRKGIVTPTARCFVFIYIYELLNGIGARSAEEGFFALEELGSKYSDFYPEITAYINKWLLDYAVYYRLDPMIISELDDLRFDNYLMTFISCEEASPDELFAAAAALSAYHIESSPFYKQYPEDYKAVFCSFFRDYSRQYEKTNGKTLVNSLFGKKATISCYLFTNAVFYRRETVDDYIYKVNDVRSYVCKRGILYCDRYYGSRGNNIFLGDLMKAVDSEMRKKYGFRYKLKTSDASKSTVAAVHRAINTFLEKKERIRQEQQRKNISIDLSKLGGIRDDADIVREKLIIDEEELPLISEQQPDKITEAAEKGYEVPEKSTEMPDTELAGQSEPENSVFSPVEIEFLRLLLENKNAVEYAKNSGIMPSLLCDGINEKFYDIIGDAVIDFDGDMPYITEDYAEDVITILEKG